MINATTARPQTRERMAVLADHMADGCPSIIRAANDLGWTQGNTERLWKMVRRELGWQAA